jgi:DNA polymerase I-like protein with 3'-5' exonuclease and polymerase domains
MTYLCHLFNKVFYYSEWSDNTVSLHGDFIALKVVLHKDLGKECPRFASKEIVQSAATCALFAVASSGEKHVVIPFRYLPSFILSHKSKFFVIYDVAVEFYVIDEILKNHTSPDAPEALEWWWEIVTQCRMRDPSMLDILIRLAISDDYTSNRNLIDIVKEYNPEYAESQIDDHVLGQRLFSGTEKITLEQLDLQNNNIAAQAIRDVIAIVPAYVNLQSRAIDLMNQYYKHMYADALTKFGPLSEAIQVKGLLALVNIEINGIYIDRKQVKKVKKKMEQKLKDSIEVLIQNPDYSGLFKLKISSNGKVTVAPDEETKKPSVIQEKLREILMNVTQEIEEKYAIQVIAPMTGSGDSASLSFSRKKWSEYEAYHPFVKNWLEMERAAHYLAYLRHIKSDYVHPQYTVLVRNGRTSCKSPPIQQTPRSGGFREVFKASPGHVLVTMDYKFIELCTLAIVCESRYGRSVLADVIRRGLDPHSFTASIFEGQPFPVFMSWKDSPNPDLQKRYTTMRQRAKAINFGIPSGLSSRGLSEYAKSEYGIELTDQEADNFRKALITVVYPEIGLYLRESEMETLAQNLGCSEQTCWKKFGWKSTSKSQHSPEDKKAMIVGGLRNIIRGKTARKDGTDYSKYFMNKVWKGLEELVRDPKSLEAISSACGTGSEELYKYLLGKDVCTLTGRIRGKVGFTQACNTPFSGLAADGAKLAMWNLLQVGFKIVGFIHDEILIEITEDSDWDKEVALIKTIVCNSMQDLTGTIPISCEYSISRVWSKDAKAVYNSQGKLDIWTPPVDTDDTENNTSDNSDENENEE